MSVPESLEAALVHFHPALPEHRLEAVLVALREIAEVYRRDAVNKVRFTAPVPMASETEAEYAARLVDLSATPAGRGRPKALAAYLLVLRLRELLVAEGCEHGVLGTYDGPGQRFKVPCYLAELARAVDVATGSPARARTDAAWRNIAAKVSRPLWILQRLGMKVEGGGDAATFNAFFRAHEAKPPARKKD